VASGREWTVNDEIVNLSARPDRRIRRRKKKHDISDEFGDSRTVRPLLFSERSPQSHATQQPHAPRDPSVCTAEEARGHARYTPFTIQPGYSPSRSITVQWTYVSSGSCVPWGGCAPKDPTVYEVQTACSTARVSFVAATGVPCGRATYYVK
jgi:hypothetical protein